MATSERGTRPWLFLVVGVETKVPCKTKLLGTSGGEGPLGSGDDATKDRDLDAGVVTRTCRMLLFLGGHDADLTGTEGNISYELQPADELDDYRSATRPAHQCAWSGGINDHWICFHICHILRY